MTSRLIQGILVAIAICGTPAGAQTDDTPISPPSDSEPSRGLTRTDTPAADVKTGRSWAIVVGTNYSGRTLGDPKDRFSLAPLNNAEADAAALATLLVKGFGYRTGDAALTGGETWQPLSKENSLTCLLGSNATAERVNEQLSWLIQNGNVSENDTVLFFFAGHGVKIVENQTSSSAILPFDAELSGGKPINHYLSFHGDLVGKYLSQCPARHKLVVLDACYSGEIFKQSFQPSVRGQQRQLGKLKNQPVLQAIASCHGFQPASDGNGANSPFTASLLRNLQQLPSKFGGSELYDVSAHDLFDSIWADMHSYSQNPECRILKGDGEFSFVPDRKSAQEFFASSRPRVDEAAVLQAGIASEKGDWWFEDKPWFIPSLRQEIIKRVGVRDSGIVLIPSEQIREAAKSVMLSTTVPSTSTPEQVQLFEMRRRHAKLMHESRNRRQSTDDLKTIVKDLEGMLAPPGEKTTSAEPCCPLEASDLHLLAIAYHALRDEKAEGAYRRATVQYRRQADLAAVPADAPPSGSKEMTPIKAIVDKAAERALLALCMADHAHYLLEAASSPKEAVDLFREARQIFRDSAPPAFRIFVLCRESDGLLKMNRWAEAEVCLEQAIIIAEKEAPEHFITADAHKRRAWAWMMQWQIHEAEREFRKSNDVLQKSVGAGSAPDANAGQPQDDVDDLFHLAGGFDENAGAREQIMRLHNLHGLSMARRFRGDLNSAIRSYRRLIREIEYKLSPLQQSKAGAGTEAEPLLYERLVNSMERLGDCNLFGPPQSRDLMEACDDYRRALDLSHRYPEKDRDRLIVSLLYKRALGLAVVQSELDPKRRNLTLSRAMASRADSLCSQLGMATEGLAALQAVVSPVVRIVESTEGGRDQTASTDPRATLRKALIEFRDRFGPMLHRDQLEICLIASRVLVDHGQTESPLDRREDVALLTSFCRMALAPFGGRRHSNAAASAQTSASPSRSNSETRSYLRPYYDSVVRSLLSCSDANTKELIEIQWEATRGTRYVKPVGREGAPAAIPTLALYVLDSTPHLFVDVPHGPGKTCVLAGAFQFDRLSLASQTGQEALPLPPEAEHQLAEWIQLQQDSNGPLSVVCLPEDSDWQTRRVLSETGSNTERTRSFRPQFPFAVPQGLVEMTSEELSVGAPRANGLDQTPAQRDPGLR
jgi:tetratricopeptide (TPR) repeat protein